MTTMRLRMQHTSLEHSDRPIQQEHDVKALFDAGGRFPIKTGTEAFSGKTGNSNRELLMDYAEEYDHIINFASDNWVAVDRKIVTPRSAVKEDIFLASNDTMEGPGTDRIMATLSFVHVLDGVGRIHVGAVHYPVKGQDPSEPNYHLNVACARGIQRWLGKVATGDDLGFVNGDFNMPDHKTDWALGGNFTSMADELEAWQRTGPGPIDGFCSYDRDGRVSAQKFNVLGDKELPLFTNHFLCRGTWEIRLLGGSA